MGKYKNNPKLIADKDTVSIFRELTVEEVVQLKTIIRDIPKGYDRIAYKLYEKLEGRLKNTKMTIKNDNDEDVIVTFEQEFYLNKKKLVYYKQKVQRSLNINLFPKGTCDTFTVIDIIKQEARNQQTRRKNSSFSISGLVKKVGKQIEKEPLKQEDLDLIDNISIEDNSNIYE